MFKFLQRQKQPGDALPGVMVASANPPAATDAEDMFVHCCDCGDEFIFTVGEQTFYRDRKLTIPPRRCPACRLARRKELRGSPKGDS